MIIGKEYDEGLMSTYGRFSVALESGSGAIAVDTEGKRYVDFGSGIGVNALGYCDTEWVEAVQKQAATLQHISNLYYSPVQSQFAAELCRAAGFAKAFLANSGAEANECMIKLARKYSSDKYQTDERGTVVTLVNSFHGRTLTTLTATGQDVFHHYFLPLTPGFRYAPAGDLQALQTVLDDSCCAVMVECVQGEGGVVPLEPAYLQAVAALCKERDLLLLVDEVQTGMGRTGKLLACEHMGVKPDAVSLAKGLGGGLPVGACLCSEALGSVLSAGTHGSTFGGNPVVCAGGRVVLKRITADGFLEDVAKKGDYIRQRLAAMPHIAETRGLGMMVGAVLDKGTAKEVAQKCLEKGLLILTAKTLLRFLPPLTISQKELDEGLAVLESVLTEL